MASPEQVPKKGLELTLAEFEIRMRTFITQLLEPTIERMGNQEAGVEGLKKEINRLGDNFRGLSSRTQQTQQQIATVDIFRDEMNRLELERVSQDIKNNEELKLLKNEFETFRYNLERKDGDIQGIQRSSNRLSSEVARVLDSQDGQKQATEERLTQVSKEIRGFRRDIEVKLTELETKQSILADALWGEETGLAKIAAELNKTNNNLSVLTEETKHLAETRASSAALEAVQADLQQSITRNESEVQSLSESIKTVVGEVKGHFQTASNTMAAHNAVTISEIRQAYTEELDQLASTRAEVDSFMHKTVDGLKKLEKSSEETKLQTQLMIGEAREELTQFNERRKRDRSDLDMEQRQLKSKVGSVFSNSDVVLKGMQHITGVLALMLESEKVAASLENQDNQDRKSVALTGLKETQGSSEGGGKTKKGGSVMSLDKRCLACSGNSAHVLAGFKMACLQYRPAPVQYGQKVFQRDELLQIRMQLLEQCYKALENGPESRSAKNATQA